MSGTIWSNITRRPIRLLLRCKIHICLIFVEGPTLRCRSCVKWGISMATTQLGNLSHNDSNNFRMWYQIYKDKSWPIRSLVVVVLGLLHIDLRGVIGVNKSLIVKFPISHVIVHPTILGKNLHISIELPHLLDQITQQSDKSITPSIFKPQFEMTHPWQQVLIWVCRTPQIRTSENRKFYWLLEECCYWDVEWCEIWGWLVAD